MSNLSNIVPFVNNLRHDFKAEAIIVDIIENGLSANDIIGVPNGSFKRRFKQDVSHAEIRKLSNEQEILEIAITRDGIYDVLPEGMFHDNTYEIEEAGQDIAHDSKKQKIEEREARNFFLPLENEIFFQRIELELEERKILNRFNENLFDDIVPEFWKLDKSLPKKMVSRMVLLMHLAHKVAGNAEMTSRILQIILEEKVSIKVSHNNLLASGINQTNIDDNNLLGTSLLGMNFVLDQHDIYTSTMEFYIGPIQNSSLENYIEGKPIRRFLECFFGFFVPVVMHVSTFIMINEGEHDFVLNDFNSNILLGYNTAI
ncbi:hypothetical protein E9993_19965 [Labilibacter sediminis]|nr:hypothetical protein E9993_19965 [Labilibacter sediminis]